MSLKRLDFNRIVCIVWIEPIWIKVTNTTAASKYVQCTYLRGQESASIEISSFRPHFINFSKTVSYEVNLTTQHSHLEVSKWCRNKLNSAEWHSQNAVLVKMVTTLFHLKKRQVQGYTTNKITQKRKSIDFVKFSFVGLLWILKQFWFSQSQFLLLKIIKLNIRPYNSFHLIH